MSLFEDLDLPVVLYRPETNDGWVKTLYAHWNDLEASMALRDETVANILEETAQFEKAMNVLRPVMAHRPERTVAQALEMLEGKPSLEGKP